MLYTAVFKAKARAVLQQHWQTALLIALIVNLPSLLVQGIAAFTNTDPTMRIQALMLDVSAGTVAMEALPETVRAMLSESGVLAVAALGILAWLVTPALSLGMNHWTLDRIRGQEEPVATVFSRLSIFFKGIGLRLLIALKVFLWTLPGLAVVVLTMVFVFRADLSTQEAQRSVAQTAVMFIWAGMLLMLVLGAMEFLRYVLADFILADEPEERVRSCTSRSKELMAGRRGQFFSLIVSFILWHLLISVTAAFVASIAGDVIGLMLQMLGSLFLSVYMLTSEGVFYETLRSAPVQALQVSS